MTTALTPNETTGGVKAEVLCAVLALAVVGYTRLCDLGRRTRTVGDSVCVRAAARIATGAPLASRGMRAAVLGFAVWAVVVLAAVVGMSRGIGPG
ncbi:MAG: hypothetical protein IT198_01640 [Acidimicrobiia bacterium]|nr:hypothetical protein [Acidimicrobiia bacterium]